MSMCSGSRSPLLAYRLPSGFGGINRQGGQAMSIPFDELEGQYRYGCQLPDASNDERRCDFWVSGAMSLDMLIDHIATHNTSRHLSQSVPVFRRDML
jgi:hypothetical protein